MNDNVLFMTLVFVFICVFYSIFMMLMHPIVVEKLYYAKKGNMYKLMPLQLNHFISFNQNDLEWVCTLCFPLFFAFLYGGYFAKRFYNILIEDNDENRIASWLF